MHFLTDYLIYTEKPDLLLFPDVNLCSISPQVWRKYLLKALFINIEWDVVTIINMELQRIQEVLVACFTTPTMRIPENPQTPVMAASFPV